jgi:hypothetical protein
MSEQNDTFVNLMIAKSQEKDEERTPHKMIVPEKSLEAEPQKQMTDDEIKSVELFTLELQKRLQQ